VAVFGGNYETRTDGGSRASEFIYRSYTLYVNVLTLFSAR